MSTGLAIGALHLLRPAWLLALLALPLLPWLLRRASGTDGGWRGTVDEHLLRHQLERGGRARAPWLLAMLAWTLAVLALAGPAWRTLPQPMAQREAALAIVLELSETMRATDVKPDRLARAKFALTDLLRARSDGQFALVAFAGAPFTVAPVTDDGTTLLALLDALDPSQMPVPGARADRAIEHAAELLERAGHAEGDILLVADGADEAAIAAARAARASGYRVLVLGVGTESGAPVALPDGGFLKDAAGDILVPGLDADALARVAGAGGGGYRTLSSAREDLAALGVFSAARGAYTDQDDAQRRLVDDGPWLLVLLLPLAALGFRRGWLGCLLLMAISTSLVPTPAHAFEWSALWQRADQRAWEALAEEDTERALALAEQADAPALRGSALYRAGEHEAAAEAFAEAGGADAHYNRGNALARAGRYEEALEAYDAALAQAPGMEDAIANRAAVEDWLRRQQQQPQQGDGEQQESGEKSGEGSESDAQGETEGEGERERQDGDPQQDGQDTPPGQGDAGDQQDDASTPEEGAGEDEAERAAREQAFREQMEQALQQAAEQGEAEIAQPSAEDPAEREQRQATEHWLRRVPDDPGGLLRRKFLLEHQRRMREGED